MTRQNHSFFQSPLLRWLAAAGTAAALLVPFSASANQNNDVAELLASAAVAYVVVDAVGGFDDKHRKHRIQQVHYRQNFYRHGHRYHDRHVYRSHKRHAQAERSRHWKAPAKAKHHHDKHRTERRSHGAHKDNHRRIAFH